MSSSSVSLSILSNDKNISNNAMMLSSWIITLFVFINFTATAKPSHAVGKADVSERTIHLSPGEDFSKSLIAAVEAVNADEVDVLYFSPGTYAIPSTLEFTKRMGQGGLRITGAGAGLTKLVFNKVETAILVTLDSDIRQPSQSPSFSLDNLSLIATGACGTAVEMRKGKNDLKGGIAQKTFYNLSIDVDKGSWKIGVEVTDLTFCSFKEITIRTPGVDSVGIHITGDAAPVDHHLTGIRILGCDTGIKISGNVEGVYITQATIIGINTGLDWDTTSHEPLLAFTASHISARKSCIRINNLLQPLITGNLLYQAGSKHAWTGVDIITERTTGFDLLQISNNIFHGSPKHEKPNIGISINAASAGVVNSNIFSACDTGISLGKKAGNIKPINNVFKATDNHLSRRKK